MLNSRDIASIVVLGRIADCGGTCKDMDAFTRWAAGIPFDEAQSRMPLGMEWHQFPVANSMSPSALEYSQMIYRLACYAYALEETIIYNALIGDTEGRYYRHDSGPFWTYAEAAVKVKSLCHYARVETKSMPRWKALALVQ